MDTTVQEWFKNPDFTNLPQSRKQQALAGYFDDELADEAFDTLTPEHQARIRNNFVGINLSPHMPKPESRGVVKDMASSVASGVVGAGETMLRVGRTLDKAMGVEIDPEFDPMTRKLTNLQDYRAKTPFLHPSREAQKGWRRAVYHGLESVTQSVLAQGPSTAVAAAVTGPVGAGAMYALSGASMFGMASYDEFLEQADKMGLSREKSEPAALRHALIEGGFEFGTDLLEVATAGVLKPFTRMGKTTFTSGVQTMLSRSWKEQAARLAGTAGAETVGEMATAGVQAINLRKAGMGDERFWDAAKKAFGPALVAGTIFGGAGVHINLKQRQLTTNALTDAEAPKKQRHDAVLAVAREINKADPTLSKVWLLNATAAIQAKQPIALDQALAEPVKAPAKSDPQVNQAMTSNAVATTAVGQAPQVKKDAVREAAQTAQNQLMEDAAVESIVTQAPIVTQTPGAAVQENAPVPEPVAMTEPASIEEIEAQLSPGQQAFVQDRVAQLGSPEAVAQEFSPDDPAGQYAYALAAEMTPTETEMVEMDDVAPDVDTEPPIAAEEAPPVAVSVPDEESQVVAPEGQVAAGQHASINVPLGQATTGILLPKEKKMREGGGVRTIRGRIAQMGGINFGNFKGELKAMSVGVRKALSRKNGTPIDLVEKTLKEEGWLSADESLLDLLRDDPHILRRAPLGEIENGIFKSERELTPLEQDLREGMAHEPESPPDGEYVGMQAQDLPEGKNLAIIDGKSQDGWDVYQVTSNTGDEVVLQDDVEVRLSPTAPVNVRKEDLNAEKPLLSTHGERIQELQPAQAYPGPDRRKNLEQRKRVAEMTPDDMREALLTDHLTGLKNRRAYDEADKLAVQVLIDLDSLKWINDNLGHEAGDALLRQMGAALAETPLANEAYHISGDEFMLQADNDAAVEDALNIAQAALDANPIQVQNADDVYTNVPVRFSYGTGKTSQEADTKLQVHKQEREADGKRSQRGATPRGISISIPQGYQDQDQSTDLFQEELTSQIPANVTAAKERLKATLTDNRGSFSFKPASEILVFDDLVVLGRHVFNQGHTQLKQFTTQLKQLSGNAWDAVQHLAERVFKHVSMILGNERGSITLREGESQSGLEITRDFEADRSIANRIFEQRDTAINNAQVEVQSLQKEVQALAGKESQRNFTMGFAYDAKLKRSQASDRLDMALMLYRDLRNKPDVVGVFRKWAADKLSDGKTKPAQRITIKEQLALLNQVDNLTDAQKALADEIGTRYDRAFIIAKANKIINSFRDHYVRRIWQLPKGKEDSFSSTGGNFGFKTSTTASRRHTLDTILDGWMRGYELRIRGLTNSYGVYIQELETIVGNKDFILFGRNMRELDDRHLFSTSNKGKYKDYAPLQAGGFKVWEWAGSVKAEKGPDTKQALFVSGQGRHFFHGPVEVRDTEDSLTLWEERRLYAPKQLAEIINRMTATDRIFNSIPGLNALAKFNASIKSWILLSSFFHHMAGTRSWIFGVHHGWFKGALNDPYTGKPLTKTGMNPVTAYKAGLKKVEDRHPLITLALHNGLTLGEINDWSENLLMGQRNWAEKLARHMGLESTAKGAEKVRFWREKFTGSLFKKYFAGLKAEAFVMEFVHDLQKAQKKALKTGKTVDVNLIAKQTAELVNADFGGLHTGRMGRHPTLQKLGRLALLAIDWTESNFRTVTGMIPGVNKWIDTMTGGLPGPPGMDKIYRRFWARVAVRTAASTLLLQLLVNGWEDSEEFYKEQLLSDQWKKFRWLGVDITKLYRALGIDTKGKRKVFSIAGHFLDILKVMDPARLIKHKASPLVRAGEAVMSGTDWAERPFTGAKEFVTTGKTIKDSPYNEGLEFWDRMPATIWNQTVSMQPIQVGYFIQYLQGEEDGLTAILKSMGTSMHHAWPPRDDNPIGRTAKQDPVYDAIVKLRKDGHLKLGPPSRSISIAGTPRKLSHDQYQRYYDMSSQRVKTMLYDYVRSAGWRQLSPEQKVKKVQRAIRKARKYARDKIKREVMQADKNKQAKNRSGK